jgi:hypothetical protein
MFDPNGEQTYTPSRQRQLALARWDSEGGAGPDGPQDGSLPDLANPSGAASVDTELTRLRVRLIALENLTIALLSDASARQLDLIRDMAVFIAPRPGATRHPMTIQAASLMNSLVDRANHFREVKPDAG